MMYTNEMRQAANALDNPSSVDVFVSETDDQIFLLVNRSEVAKASRKELEDLKRYVNDLKSIVRIGGGGEARLVIV